MMSILVGMILIMVDIQILFKMSIIDIAPDFIGYILLYKSIKNSCVTVMNLKFVLQIISVLSGYAVLEYIMNVAGITAYIMNMGLYDPMWHMIIEFIRCMMFIYLVNELSDGISRMEMLNKIDIKADRLKIATIGLSVVCLVNYLSIMVRVFAPYVVDVLYVIDGIMCGAYIIMLCISLYRANRYIINNTNDIGDWYEKDKNSVDTSMYGYGYSFEFGWSASLGYYEGHAVCYAKNMYFTFK